MRSSVFIVVFGCVLLIENTNALRAERRATEEPERSTLVDLLVLRGGHWGRGSRRKPAVPATGSVWWAGKAGKAGKEGKAGNARRLVGNVGSFFRWSFLPSRLCVSVWHVVLCRHGGGIGLRARWVGGRYRLSGTGAERRSRNHNVKHDRENSGGPPPHPPPSRGSLVFLNGCSL